MKLVNRARMTTATTGTGTITLGSAVSGFQAFAAAGVSDGDTIRYVIEDGTAWEIGTGTYTASGTTLSRTVSESSNAGGAITLSGSAEVYVDAAAEDVGGLVLLQPEFITSAVSAVDFDLPAEYSRFRLIVNGLTYSSTGSYLFATISTDGGSTFLSSDYYSRLDGFSSGGSTFTVYSYPTTGVQVVNNTLTSDPASGVIDIVNGSGFWFLRSNFGHIRPGTAAQQFNTTGFRAMTAKADLLRLKDFTNNMTGGTLALYAYKES